MFYDRKIRYLNYYEAGERIRGSGFVKLEVRDKTLRFEISVKGLRDIAGTFPILLLGAGKEKVFQQLILQEGCGEHRYVCRLEKEIGETGIPYSELTGIRIPLAEGKEIACLWDGMMPHRSEEVRTQSLEPQKYAAQRQAMPEQAVQGYAAPEQAAKGYVAQKPDMREQAAQGYVAQKQATQDSAERQKGAVSRKITEGGKVPQEPDVTMQVMEEQSEGVENKKNHSSIEWVEKTETKGGKDRGEGETESAKTVNRKEKETVSEEEKMISLQEDKWTQLCAIYPHIKPFRDEREYLSISPADFVLLPAADYRAAHNSFLLHGYYNYHHLILARVEKRGEILYYLGVPGNFFEKEKQVAVMFGFESFECADEPAEYGDFGYYMMRTDI